MVQSSYILNSEKTKSRSHSYASDETAQVNYTGFDRIYSLAHLFGICGIGLVAFWMAYYKGGLGYQDRPQNEMRWHPLLMSFGLLLVNGEAILIYRGFRFSAKKYTKLAHALLQFCTILVIAGGFKTIYDSRVLNVDERGRPAPKVHLHSVHSWVGLAAAVLFGLQFLGGFAVFLLPGGSLDLRKSTLPAHRIAGVIIFVMSLCATLMGVAQLSAWKMTCWMKESYLCVEMLIANLFGMVTLAFGAVIIILVANPSWIRRPLPSEVVPPITATSYSA